MNKLRVWKSNLRLYVNRPTGPSVPATVLPAKELKPASPYHMAIGLNFELQEHEDGTYAEDDDTSIVTTCYNSVRSSLPGSGRKDKCRVKYVSRIPKFRWPDAPVALRAMDTASLNTVVVSSNETPFVKVAKLVNCNDMYFESYNMLTFLTNGLNVGNPAEEHFNPGQKCQIFMNEMLIEHNKIRLQVVRTCKTKVNKDITRRSGQQRRAYQAVFKGKLGQFSQVHCVRRCKLSNQIAERMGGERVMQDFEFMVPEMWVFPSPQLALSFYCVVVGISRGSPAFFQSIRATARRSHVKFNMHVEHKFMQLTARQSKREVDKKEREEPPSPWRVTALYTRMFKMRVPYLFLLTRTDDQSLLYFGVPDYKVYEFYRHVSRQPKKSQAEYTNRNFLFDPFKVIEQECSTVKIPEQYYNVVRQHNMEKLPCDDAMLAFIDYFKENRPLPPVDDALMSGNISQANLDDDFNLLGGDDEDECGQNLYANPSPPKFHTKSLRKRKRPAISSDSESSTTSTSKSSSSMDICNKSTTVQRPAATVDLLDTSSSHSSSSSSSSSSYSSEGQGDNIEDTTASTSIQTAVSKLPTDDTPADIPSTIPAIVTPTKNTAATTDSDLDEEEDTNEDETVPMNYSPERRLQEKDKRNIGSLLRLMKNKKKHVVIGGRRFSKQLVRPKK